MGVRRFVCGLLIPSTAVIGMGCNAFGSKSPQSAAQKAAGPSTPVPAMSARMQQQEVPAVLALPPAKPGEGDVAVRVVAYVNNLPIFDSELRESVMMHLREITGQTDEDRDRQLKELRASELNKLIEREVVVSKVLKILSSKNAPPKALEELHREANREFERRMKEIRKEMKFESDQQVRQYFAQAGMSIDNYRRTIERNFICQTFIRQLIFDKISNIPLSEIHDYYMQHPDEFTIQAHVKWQDIFMDAGRFPDRATARNSAIQVVNEIRSGTDFTKAADQLRQAGFNILPGDAGVGERPGEIRPTELESAVFALPAGQVGGPIEVGGGFHVIKVIEQTPSSVKQFGSAETQKEIRDKLQNLLAQKEYHRVVEEMKSEAVIQRLE